MPGDINISVGYDPINENNIFTCGDNISGKVTLQLEKEYKVESLIVKLKGKAEVKWTDNNGETDYYKKEKFFSISQDLIQSKQGDNVIDRGYHAFPFTFQIPPRDLPSSYEGTYGKIVYTLEANLGRSMRMDSKAKAEFTIINEDLRNDPVTKAPQNKAIETKKKLFSSGPVGMDVNIPRTGFYQGESLQVVASIQNKSSRDIKPKYLLYRKCCYFAGGERNVETTDILKEVGDPIPPSTGQTVTRTITIPSDLSVTILNCKIIKVEYRLKVYLDVKYATDPLVKFPIIILPALLEYGAGPQPDQPAYGYGAFSNSDMQSGSSYLDPPPTAPSAPPPSYGAYDIYPPLSTFDRKS